MTVRIPLADDAVVSAVDDRYRDNGVTDETWTLLLDHHGRQAPMDLVVAAGFYGLVSCVLNTAHTRLEPG